MREKIEELRKIKKYIEKSNEYYDFEIIKLINRINEEIKSIEQKKEC